MGTVGAGGRGPPRAGDKARVAAGRVKLAIVPLASGVRARLVEAATYDLVLELERTGRFQVVFGEQVSVWLAEQKIPAAEFVRGRGVREAQDRLKLSPMLAGHYPMA